jgi:hypothetical protein
VATAVLMIALAVTGVDASAVTIPVASAAVHTLNDRDAAHAPILLHVNHQIAAAIGIAQCSALLASLSMLGAAWRARVAAWASASRASSAAAQDLGGHSEQSQCGVSALHDAYRQRRRRSPRCLPRRRGRWRRRLNIAPQPTSMTPALALERSPATQISSNLRGWVWC